MNTDAEPAVLFNISFDRIDSGDTAVADLKETIYSFLLGFKGGTEVKTSRGEVVRFLGVWCPLPEDEGGQQAREYLHRWLLKHDHPKQHAFSKTLVAVCSTGDLRDGIGRVLALIRCTHPGCGACLNEDLVVNGHASAARMSDVRNVTPTVIEQHQRALLTIKSNAGSSKRFGADTLLKLMAGQTPMQLV